MAKFLFATLPFHGHISPGLPIARALVEQGHDVVWYCTSKYREKIEESGATFIPVQSATDFDDSRLDLAFPERNRMKPGLSQLKYDLKHIFFDEIVGYDADLTRILQEFPADVVVMDSGFPGMLPMKLKGHSPKTAVYGILPLALSSQDTAPFGLGLQPRAGAIGRLRNRALNLLMQRGVFRDVQAHLNHILARIGAPRLPYYLMDAPAFVNDLFLQGTCPSFEYARSDLPSTVRFVGPYLPPKASHFEPPAWWEELKGSRPVVHVTQGTLANEDFTQLLIPTLLALSSEDVLVVATTGNKPLTNVNIPLPKNAKLERFIPHHELLPYVDVMVTNGGYGGVQLAIYYGVPLVTAGRSEDKPEVCARIQWSGVGVDLKTSRPTPQQILHAVRNILNQPSYHEQTRRLSAEFHSYDAVETTTQELVRLALG